MTTEQTRSKQNHVDETNAWIRLLVMAVVTILLVGGICIVYAHHVGEEAKASSRASIQDSQRKFCGLLTTLDDAYVDAPPTTPTGQKVASEIHDLRKAYGC